MYIPIHMLLISKDMHVVQVFLSIVQLQAKRSFLVSPGLNTENLKFLIVSSCN